ncbi:hypothetical protein C3L33_02293, partial [Rhododendron williamsianum]
MANPRRSSYSILVPNNQNPDSISNNNPFQIQPQSLFQTTTTTISSSLRLFLNKPHAFPFLLFFFLLLTWVSLRLQHSAHFSSPPQFLTAHQWSGERDGGGGDSDPRLTSFGSPRVILPLSRKTAADGRLTPSPSPSAPAFQVSLSLPHIPLLLCVFVMFGGGAVNCASVHLGEIRPGGVRGNHRHYTCNETFFIWGAKTLFRHSNHLQLENKAVDRGYAEVTIGADEVAVAASPHGTAHALVNVDTARSTFFMGCQDSIIEYSNSTSDFNVWKDL